MKIKRLTNRSTFFSVMDALEAMRYTIISKKNGKAIGFLVTYYRAAESDYARGILHEKFIERKDLIEWINLELEDNQLIDREEPKP